MRRESEGTVKSGWGEVGKPFCVMKERFLLQGEWNLKCPVIEWLSWGALRELPRQVVWAKVFCD